MSRPINILLMGGAKRVAMARKIEEAFAKRNKSVRYFSLELERTVPIACMATVIIGYRWSDERIYSLLRDIVKTHTIDIIIPFVDGAIEVTSRFLMENPELNLFAPVASTELVSVLFDKKLSATLFEANEIPIPKTHESADGAATYPLIAKPRKGSASKGIKVIHTPEELQSLDEPDNYLIQQYVEEAEEISVDCYMNVRDFTVQVISPRRRLETLGGEAVRSVTIENEAIYALSKEILLKLSLIGASTLQFLIPKENPSEVKLMEINPRFGGGVLCSIGAGADVAACLADDFLGLPTITYSATPGTLMVRYFQDVIFKP